MKNISENSINFEITDKIFLSYQDKINLENDHKTYLKDLKKDDLKIIIRQMALLTSYSDINNLYNNIDKYTKNDLYEYVLKNQGFLIEIFIRNLDINSFKSLNILINLVDKNGYYKFNYRENIPFNILILNILSDMKFAYLKTKDNHTEIHIPKDNLKIIKKLLKNPDISRSVNLNSEILKRIYGLTTVYGAIKLSDISRLDSYFKKYDNIDIQLLFSRLMVFNVIYKIFMYNDEPVVCCPEIRNESEVKKILETDMDYKIYSKDVLDKFSNETYVDTLKPYKELLKELKSINYSYEDIKYIKDYVINDYIAMSQLNEEIAKDFFWLSVRSFSNVEGFNNHLYETVIKIADKWPKWNLKGNIKNNEIVKVVKVGRNEPCPCNSGKKYKKCCGK